MNHFCIIIFTIFIHTLNGQDLIKEQCQDIVRETEADLKKLQTALTHKVTPAGVIATTAMRNLVITGCSYQAIKMIIPKHTKSTVCGAVGIGIAEQASSDTNTLYNGIKYGAHNHKTALESLKKNRERCLKLLQNMQHIKVSQEETDLVHELNVTLEKIIKEAEIEKPIQQTISPEQAKLYSIAGSALGSVTFLGCKVAVKVLSKL